MGSAKRRAQKLWDELSEQYRGKNRVDQGNPYWASEWSWKPIFDGFLPSKHEKYPYFAVVNGLSFYATNTNYRIYAPWDLFTEKEECQKLCDKKNSCGYEWDILYNEKLKEFGLKIEPGKAEQFGWFRYKPKVLALRIADWFSASGWPIVSQMETKPGCVVALVKWENDDGWMDKIGLWDGKTPVFAKLEEYGQMLADPIASNTLKNKLVIPTQLNTDLP